jgi:branched-chain amino acid transport system ATP-binding protein
MLELEGVDSYYGQVRALSNVSLSVKDGEVVALLGANGAGKSTVLRTVSGLVHPRKGRVTLDDEDISGLSPYSIARRGISHCPEGRLVFETMTVEENLELGAYFIGDRRAVRQRMEEMFTHFPILKERLRQRAGTLSGGEQQMLAIARAMMPRPKIVLLDEPSLGLAPVIMNTVFRIIRELHEAGNTILLVEQNARKALDVADRAYILETGSVVLTGNAPDLRQNENVKRKYLGE